jgi:hypothetical protein
MVDASAPVKPLGIKGHEEEIYAVDAHGKALGASLGPVVDLALEQIRSRVAITNIRSLFSCIGVGEAEPFTVPPQQQMLARLKTNGNYFLTNYLFVSVAVFFFLLYVVASSLVR